MITIDLDMLDDYNESELVGWLKHQDDLYENEGQSDVEDDVYDAVRRYTQLTYPANQYFTGVGSDVRGSKVRLPYPMAGLTQIHCGELTPTIGKSATRHEEYVVSDKLDGTSAQVIYDANGDLQIAYSRGNGTEGADITRHIKLNPNIPNKLKKRPGTTLPVRIECIIPKNLWSDVKSKFTTRKGEQYINARNAVAGLMNASENDPAVYQYIHCVAYTIMESDLKKLDQLQAMDDYGFNVVRYTTMSGGEMTDDNLSDYLNKQRNSSVYELDGVVCNLNVHTKDTNGQPKAFKYKVADATNTAVAVVKEIPIKPSKDGYLKPRIFIHPVKLAGVTVMRATAFNAKFIYDNQIQPGTKIRITRSGDVIPFVQEVVHNGPLTGDQYKAWFNDQLQQFGNWKWSKNKVDAILTNFSDNKEVALNRLVHVFTNLKIAHLKRGNLEKLFDAGFKSIPDILNMDCADLYLHLGENGAKVEASMEKRLADIYWPEFVGALNLFGRGIGVRKISALYNEFQGDYKKMADVDVVAQVEGFDTTTAELIADNYQFAIDTLDQIDSDWVNIRTYDPNKAPSGEKMANQVVVFTGLRLPDLEQEIVDQGGTIGNSVSKKTTIVCAKDPNSTSGKLKKARTINQQLGKEQIAIVDLRGLEKMML